MLTASEQTDLFETADRANNVRHAMEHFLAMVALEVIMDETVNTLLQFTNDADREGADWNSDTDREGADRAGRKSFLFRGGNLDD